MGRVKNPPKYSLTLRAKTIAAYKGGMKVKDIAAKYKVSHESMVYKWIRDAGQGAGTSHQVDPKGQPDRVAGRLGLYIKSDRAQLLQMIGEQAVELARLRKRA